ncbi:von Willebrand factor type A domain-containing protein [uncultured Dysgonomonas sp.]|nr:von Willebrand factor type A domain-containing protein [uncultured Dysgonomonas sp.]
MFSYTIHAITVTGTVREDNGDELIGVSVMVKGTTKGTVTDVNGEYTIEANIGDQLQFSYLGFISQTIKVTGSKHDVVLKEDSKSLDEMVVVGYGVLSSDSYSSYSYSEPAPPVYFDNTESYRAFTDNKFVRVSTEPLSTFSIDVDKASYSNMRRFINKGEVPPADAIRVEELVNYFKYDYPKPEGDDPVAFGIEVGKCPWDGKHRLVKIGLKAREIDTDNLPATNFVFLIDVSGSMDWDGKLDLVKSSMKLLVNNLRPIDRVAIVVYAGAAGQVLPSTPGSEKSKILESLNGLTAGGSTAGGEGIVLAYKIAKENLIEGGNNRIILCTDGDFNVGVSSNDGLEKLIENERKSGVFLSILGYGMGNYKDDKMQVLAQAGNGNHAYIDNMQEANKVLVSEFGGTMFTVAKDVKLQIEFNPLKVDSYRLIGYETRLLEKEDFNNDQKDAGDMGMGHTVTAFYEVIPAKEKKDKKSKGEDTSVDPLKYQTMSPTGSDELLTVKLRYKHPESEESKLMSVPVIDDGLDNVSEDFKFGSAVAMFGIMLRDDKQHGSSDLYKVISRARSGYGKDEDGYRREFVRLVQSLTGE